MEFLSSTYEAAATTGNWDRTALECPLGVPGVPRPIARSGGHPALKASPSRTMSANGTKQTFSVQCPLGGNEDAITWLPISIYEYTAQVYQAGGSIVTAVQQRLC